MKIPLMGANWRSKLIPSLLLAAAFVFAVATTAQAQTKMAYIDAGRILKRMPEASDAQARLEQFVQNWTKEVEDIRSELSRKQTEFDRRKLLMTDAERSALQLDIQNLKKRIADFQQQKFGDNGELFTQQTSLMRAAYDKLAKAIDEVARDNGFDYVFDKSAAGLGLLYSNTKYDITLKVAKKMNIETDFVTQPLQNSVQPGQTNMAPPRPQGNEPPRPETLDVQPANPNGVPQDIHVDPRDVRTSTPERK